MLLTASFGHLIPAEVLERYPPLHTLNLHPSLLPRYRGAAPIQWALINGDRESGVTVQSLSRGKFDRGDILAQKEVVRFRSFGFRLRLCRAERPDRNQVLEKEDKYVQVENVMANLGTALLVDVLRDFTAFKVSHPIPLARTQPT